MGVHAGETLRRDNDHFGPVMNRAARIMAAGHGGQVLVSQAVIDQTSAGLAAETGFRDLGAHRLKDLTEPEHLFQLVHPGLVPTFPTSRHSILGRTTCHCRPPSSSAAARNWPPST